MKAILATTHDYLLGLNGGLPWGASSEFNELSKMDMDYFREITKGTKVVMGYKTWLSLNERPLKGRREHYIITSKRNLKHADKRVKFMCLEDFLGRYVTDDVVCIGGASLYNELLNHCNEVYWNELTFKNNPFEKIDGDGVNPIYLTERNINMLQNPSDFGFRPPAKVLIFDSNGNSIIFHRFIKNPILRV